MSVCKKSLRADQARSEYLKSATWHNLFNWWLTELGCNPVAHRAFGHCDHEVLLKPHSEQVKAIALRLHKERTRSMVVLLRSAA